LAGDHLHGGDIAAMAVDDRQTAKALPHERCRNATQNCGKGLEIEAKRVAEADMMIR